MRANDSFADADRAPLFGLDHPQMGGLRSRDGVLTSNPTRHRGVSPSLPMKLPGTVPQHRSDVTQTANKRSAGDPLSPVDMRPAPPVDDRRLDDVENFDEHAAYVVVAVVAGG